MPSLDGSLVEVLFIAGRVELSGVVSLRVLPLTVDLAKTFLVVAT